MYIELFKEREPLKTSRYFTVAYAEANIDGEQKEIVIKRAISEEAFPMWKQERDMLTLMKNPGIVQLLGSSEEKKELYLEKIPGKTLFQYNKDVDLSLFEKLNIIRQITDTLCYVHSYTQDKPPIVLGDVSDTNIIIRPDVYKSISLSMKPVFYDMQYSFLENNIPSFLKHKIYGTPQFIAPETMGYKVVNTKTRDVYSTGIVMYVLLSDEFPYAFYKLNNIEPQFMLEWVSGEIATHSPKKLESGVEKLDDVVMSAIDKNYRNRCTADELNKGIYSII